MVQDDPEMGPGAPKTLPRRPQAAPIGPEEAPRGFPKAPDKLKFCKKIKQVECLKKSPVHCRWASEACGWPPKHPERPHEEPQTRPKMLLKMPRDPNIFLEIMKTVHV